MGTGALSRGVNWLGRALCAFVVCYGENFVILHVVAFVRAKVAVLVTRPHSVTSILC